VSSTANPATDFYIEPLVAENIEGLWDDLNMLLADLSRDGKAYQIRNQQKNYIHAVAITAFFKFVDDVEFHFRPEEGRIDMRSESRVGYSDLGANRKRLEKIRALLQPKSN
jgi:uncharacterized protein (DUF1499 family)